MKILRVAQKLYPEHKGGGAYHVHAMSRDQAAMGHDVTVLTVTDDEDLPNREVRSGYTIIRKSSTVDIFGNAISIGVGDFLRTAVDYDVIHAHSHLYFSTNLAALKRLFSDIPLAITNHGLYSQNAPRRLFEGYLRTFGRITFDIADAIFCYTPEDRSRLRELGVGANITVVQNGVDTEQFCPDGPTSELIDHNGPVVLFVGRLVQGKRPQDAIETMRMLPGDLNAKCYIVGDGPLKTDVAATGDGLVEFLGHMSYDEMPSIFRSADVLVLPSQAEGFPRTILESMASGVPVVCSDLSQVAPVINGGGETVTVGDVEGFAREIERVLKESQAYNPRETIEEVYDWSSTVEQTTDRLRELIAADTSEK